MAKLSHSDSRRMYSWWWDSHISPKNSKWLQDNLTDMDSKVKTMIKLIEEDADSFARRAEMYYKKRPELMKMVEEFYRAYRALAERYDHATGVIRHAHRTMSEAFPNQVPQLFADDSPANSVSKTVPRTPNISTPAQALCEEGSLQFDSLNSSNSHAIKQNGEFTDDSDSVTRRIVEVRKGLNFDEVEEREQSMQDSENHSVKEETQSRSEKVSESEGILTLKEALAKLEAEKEAGLAQYQQSLDKISILESDIAHAREVSRELSDRASKAENEAVSLKEELSKSESEKEANLQKYHQCLDKISNLEKNVSSAQEDLEELNERASRAETEAHSLKDELTVVAVEKDTALNNYMRSLEMISNLENNLEITEEDAKRLKERAEKAESEVEILKQTVSKLTKEKEAAALQYQQCLETISCLEKKLTNAQEEAQRLNSEIDYGVSKLKGVEEQCLLLERSYQSLHSELEPLMLKMETQTQELTEKDSELGRLWACIQEERLRFVEAETAFQTLQHLHAQTQEELRSLASELQRRAELLKTVESHNQSLQDEVLQVKEENKNLNEINESSALSIKDMENGITGLKGRNRKLEEEVELRLDERNALQQEIYCLKEELNDLNKNHISVLEQVHAVGINPRSLGSSVKELQDENLNLKETCSREQNEKVNLLKKLEILEQLLEKNSILETSLSDLNAELELVRGQMEALDQSCRSLSEEKSSLLDEKDTLMTQLQVTSENLEKLLEKNSFLDNSLSDAHDELQALRAESTSLENSYQLIEKEKAVLISERGDLTSQLETTQTKLEDMFKTYGDLKEKYKALEKEKESTLGKLEGLQMSLDVERQKHAHFVQMNDQRFTDIQAEMELLQEESQQRKRELEEVLDNALNYDIETFVLRITVQDLEENSCSLLIKHQKLLEESSSSEKLISNLERDNVEQKVQIKSLFNQATSLRERTYEVMKALHIVQDRPCDDQNGQDHIYLNQLLNKVQDMKKSLHQAEIENLQQTVELSVLVILIGHLRLEAQNLELEKNTVEHEFRIKTEKFLMLQSKVFELNETNKELLSKLREGDCKEEVLMAQIEDLHRKLTNMQDACRVLHGENLDLHKEKRSLTDAILLLKQNKHILQEENWILYGEMLTLDNLSFIFGNCIDEKCVLLRQLGSDLNKLHDVNGALMGNLSFAEGRLEKMQMENAHVKEGLQKTEEELRIFSIIKDNLTKQIENGENVLNEKELKLQEAEQKVNLLETKNFELNKLVEGLSMESNELKMIREGQENQILKLSADNGALTGNLSLAEGRLEKMQMENDHVKEGLLKAEEELSIFSIVVKDNLTKQIENGENMLNGKELELQEAEQKVNLLENKNFELTKLVEGLSMESNELKMIREGQENQILKLSAGNGALMGNLSLAEGRLEKMQMENDHVKEGLLKAEEELRIFSIVVKDNLTKQIENGENMLNGKELELQEAEQKVNLLENKNFELTKLVEGLSMESNELKMIREGQENQILKLSAGNGALMGNLSLAEGRLEKMQMENDHVKEGLLKAEEELRIFSIVVKDNLTKQIENGENMLNGKELELQEAEQKVNLLENKNFELTKLVEGLSMESNELKMIREGQENQILKLSAGNGALMGNLSLAEGRLEKMQMENDHVKEGLLKAEEELRIFSIVVKDNLTKQIENGENMLNGKELELQEAEQKVNLLENKNFELTKLVEGLSMESNELKMIREGQENQILKLSADNDHLSTENNHLYEASHVLELNLHNLHGEHKKRKTQEENLHSELHKKINEIEMWEIEAASQFNQLQMSIVSQLLYEQKFHELCKTFVDSINENEGLRTQLAAYGPTVISLEECISSLEKNISLPVKRQDSDNEKMEGSQERNRLIGNYQNENENEKRAAPETFSGLQNLQVRIQAIEQAAVEIYQLRVQENVDLHLKLKAATRQVEELKSESSQYRRNLKSSTEISEADNILLTKDIMLDQISESSSRNHEVTEKGRRGKALTECETLKGQLEEADISIMKSNDLNGKLIKSIENNSVPLKGQLEEADISIMKLNDLNGKLIKSIENNSVPNVKSSFDSEDDGNAERRRIPKQARRISKKIGRLQLEVQKLQFVLLKLDKKDNKEKTQTAETNRRPVLGDYLYGGGRRTTNGRKKSHFCSCLQPSTTED